MVLSVGTRRVSPIEAVKLDHADSHSEGNKTKIVGSKHTRTTNQPTKKKKELVGSQKMNLAEANFHLGNNETAFRLLGEALKEQANAYGWMNVHIARTLVARAIAYRGMHKMLEASEDVELAVHIFRSKGDENPQVLTELVDALLLQSSIQHALLYYVEAQRSLDDALAILVGQDRCDSIKMAEAYYMKATQLHQRRRMEDAREAYSKALKIHQQLGRKYSSQRVKSIRRFTLTHDMMGYFYWKGALMMDAARNKKLVAEV